MTSETLGELDVRPGTHHQRHTRMPEAMRCEILGVVRVPSLERVVMLSIAQTNSLPRGRIGTAGDRQAVSLLEALDRLDGLGAVNVEVAAILRDSKRILQALDRARGHGQGRLKAPTGEALIAQITAPRRGEQVLITTPTAGLGYV